jgi:hypothetical protein
MRQQREGEQQRRRQKRKRRLCARAGDDWVNRFADDDTLISNCRFSNDEIKQLVTKILPAMMARCDPAMARNAPPIQLGRESLPSCFLRQDQHSGLAA